jgi:hypothetical protein
MMLDVAQLMRRLVTCLPSATFEMDTFCRLAGIEISDKVPTAAMECVRRPHLLLNPDFITRYCQRDEHLFLMVMHEIWHVLLAHTRMYPRLTPAQNIAFDAVINATLRHQFSGPQYDGFFDVLYKADKFPELLLRPPHGWPNDPQYVDGSGPEGTLSVMRRLYPPLGARWQPPLYDEILALLRQYLREHGNLADFAILLLGDHDSPNEGQHPMLKQMMERITGKWPKMALPGSGRGDGQRSQTYQTTAEDASFAARQTFASVLRHALLPRGGSERQRKRTTLRVNSGLGVLPNPRDRQQAAKRRLGAPTTLWTVDHDLRARLPDTVSLAQVYLDVSGSMGNLLPLLVGLITPYVLRRQAEVYQFSTKVEPLPTKALREGKLKTTMGTNINCVLNHALQLKPPVSKILIVTDGMVGKPDARLVAQVRERHMRVYVVLPSESAHRTDLSALATQMSVLPPLRIH